MTKVLSRVGSWEACRCRAQTLRLFCLPTSASVLVRAYTRLGWRIPAAMCKAMSALWAETTGSTIHPSTFCNTCPRHTRKCRSTQVVSHATSFCSTKESICCVIGYHGYRMFLPDIKCNNRYMYHRGNSWTVHISELKPLQFRLFWQMKYSVLYFQHQIVL